MRLRALIKYQSKVWCCHGHGSLQIAHPRAISMVSSSQRPHCQAKKNPRSASQSTVQSIDPRTRASVSCPRHQSLCPLMRTQVLNIDIASLPAIETCHPTKIRTCAKRSQQPNRAEQSLWPFSMSKSTSLPISLLYLPWTRQHQQAMHAH